MEDNIQRILDSINEKRIAEDTLDFLNVISETGNEKKGCDFLINILKRENLDIIVDEFIDKRPNVYTSLSGINPEGGKSLMFNGHIDTIPIGISDPPEIKNNMIIGRGAEDMKGGLIAVIHAISAIKKSKINLSGDVSLTSVVGHETPIGQKEGPKRLIELLKSRKMTPDAIVITEGPNAIWTAGMGFINFTITIHSEKGSIHTINTTYSENPIYWAGKILMELQNLELEFENSGYHQLCGRNQLNIGKINGGDYFNRLPSDVTINGTLRWNPNYKMKDILSKLQGICSKISKKSNLKTNLTIEENATKQPFQTSLDHPIINSLKNAGKKVTKKSPEIIGMALSTDANLYSYHTKIPTVGFGPQYKTAHSDHEKISINSLHEASKIYALTAIEYCGIYKNKS
tara:strand:- start:817 stop:2022 length:1206 start_codon:yes stop_codon:yes gene_type:complete